jgi:thioredoxin-related protein
MIKQYCFKGKRSAYNLLLFITILIVLIITSVSGFTAGLSQSKQDIPDVELKWFNYNQGLTKSKVENNPILIYFYSDNCSYCRKLETETFANKEIAEIMNKYFALIKINSDSSNIVLENGKKISERALSREVYQVRGYPTVWFLGKNKDRIASLPGFIEPVVFKNILENVLAYIEGSHYKEVSFPEYYKKRNQ